MCRRVPGRFRRRVFVATFDHFAQRPSEQKLKIFSRFSLGNHHSFARAARKARRARRARRSMGWGAFPIPERIFTVRNESEQTNPIREGATKSRRDEETRRRMKREDRRELRGPFRSDSCGLVDVRFSGQTRLDIYFVSLRHFVPSWWYSAKFEGFAVKTIGAA